jgi:branched-chain amino acid transport system ATP-binding protein
MKETLLTLENIEAGYKDLKVLQGVSLHINKGEIVALLGQNGAGKSTILKVIINLVKHTKGHIKTSATIAYVPQGKRIFSNLTVKENILLVSKEKEIPSYLIELFPVLASKSDKLAGKLSGGEQQMVALARGLIHKPELLLLDEPSLGLSPKFTKEVFAIINAIRNDLGISVIVIEHNLSSLISIADRGYVLEHGKVAEELTGKDFQSKEAVYNAIMGRQ